jgi:hypothetical protein
MAKPTPPTSLPVEPTAPDTGHPLAGAALPNTTILQRRADEFHADLPNPTPQVRPLNAPV